jgi:uncharacterized protein (DUF736 family)
MLNLGTFEKDPKTGKLTGTFYGVNMYPTKLIFEPKLSKDDKPYYDIYAQSQHATVEAGAAWPKTGKNGKPHIGADCNFLRQIVAERRGSQSVRAALERTEERDQTCAEDYGKGRCDGCACRNAGRSQKRQPSPVCEFHSVNSSILKFRKLQPSQSLGSAGVIFNGG